MLRQEGAETHALARLCSRRRTLPALGSMSDSAVTLRTKKFITNRLLQRKQFVRCRPPDGARQPCSLGRFGAGIDPPSLHSTSRTRCACLQVCEVIHPGLASVSKSDIKDKLAKLYKVRAPLPRRRPRVCAASTPHPGRTPGLTPQVSDPSCVLVYGFKVAFGGGRSSGFGLIYDNIQAAKKFEPKYRLTRFGMGKAKAGGRKGRKEKKNRLKKLRGTKKAKTGAK